MIRRIHVENKPGFRQRAEALAADLRQQLGLPGLATLRVLLRYDVEGVDDTVWQQARATIFSEPPLDDVYDGAPPVPPGAHVFAVEYLPGQYDQRADSAGQCLRLLADCAPQVATATLYIVAGDLSAADIARIKRHLINPVDSREATLELPATLARQAPEPAPVRRLDGFRTLADAGRAALHAELGLAMSPADLAFCQRHFADSEQRDPSVTEIRALDTYWSDHCRHTTFLTEIDAVAIDPAPLTAPITAAWESYRAARAELYGEDAAARPVCLMDIALCGMRDLRRRGLLPDLEESEEVNAASIVVTADVDGQPQEWLVLFKNETHNHPTEIEPFGGAATCLGGAIRDPLSGRSYVYQAMRVTGSGDPRAPLAATLPGKLPQRKISTEAAQGYSSYGNQIGLATGQVAEIYHPGYIAKRMEVGAVIAAAPRAQVRRARPAPGDIVVLVGGRTGRDGIGGATGSSKEHDTRALENCAEVQKGDPTMERKLQRLFRIPEISLLIKRCNDFGAGGVAVAIGELAPALDIDLDAVPLKYAGLDGSEIALSESQERMAVVLEPAAVATFTAAAAAENLEATVVARVADHGRLRMRWRGDLVVDLPRAFLDTNGVRQRTAVRVRAPDPAANPLRALPDAALAADLQSAWQAVLADLNVCSQQGLVERFDSSIGAATVLHPFGGAHGRTPAEAMCALLPMPVGASTSTATLMSFGFHPLLAAWSPFHGAVYAVVEALARVVAAGGDPARVRLTLQEYFEKLRDDPTRWGKPFAALLGAWTAQRALGIAAIGGKDSMSGSFGDRDVPPTLIAFAVCPVDARQVISPEFKRPGHAVSRLVLPRDAADLPDWEALRRLYAELAGEIAAGRVVAAQTIREGGLAAALSKMCFGNRIGFAAGAELDDAALFARAIGDIVLEWADGIAPALGQSLGATIERAEIHSNGVVLGLDALLQAWQEPLEGVFPTRASEPPGAPGTRLFEPRVAPRAGVRIARPRVLIPVFPGTNCEYDSARAFQLAGAEPEILVFRNRDHRAVEESINAMAKALGTAQILMLPGGFSAGDEPGGSGRFIAAVLRNPRVADALMHLLQARDGLVLGVCNGFQALVKVGLLPHGEIRPLQPDSPTLALNAIGRHVSCYVHTKVVSKRSPWLGQCALGAVYRIPLSHGEGRFVAPAAVLRQLFCDDQVATQYCAADGLPTHALPDNANGSLQAIEGITSPCGRIFGKMGHSERCGPLVAKNVPGDKYQPIFASGVAYYG
jgi:phosphoribosylformylglycinamidine synthase